MTDPAAQPPTQPPVLPAPAGFALPPRPPGAGAPDPAPSAGPHGAAGIAGAPEPTVETAPVVEQSPPVPAPGFDSKGRVRRTRVSGVWVGLVAAAVFLILLIIFIAQNLTRVGVHFLGLSGHMSIGLIMLISAVCGVIIAAVPGSIRILQLRRALKKNAPVHH